MASLNPWEKLVLVLSYFDHKEGVAKKYIRTVRFYYNRQYCKINDYARYIEW